MSGSQRSRPPVGAVAEALFALSDREPESERRLALLKAAYTLFDHASGGERLVLAQAPAWLQPLLGQLLTCPSEGALEAAVQRLSGGDRPRRDGMRERYLARAEVAAILAAGDPELAPERMRGAFHWHTTSSDGKAALEVMARACRRRGASWAVVTDHSRGLEVVSGLDLEGVRLQRRQVDAWNRRASDDLLLFQGLEVEVLEDGSLDVPRGERLEVDCVVAAVHSGFERDRDQTERLVRAVTTRGVHVLAHPRGRHFHSRSGIRARWERVFEACAAAGVAVEVNGFPRRQDLDWELARLAVDSGCEVILASDAHAVPHLEFDAYACAIACRAGIPPGRVLNTRSAEVVADWLGLGRQ